MATIKAFKPGGAAPRRKGDRFEYKVKKYLEYCGYWVRRAGKSSFPDLVAVTMLYNSKILGFFIEVKMNKYISKEEKTKLKQLQDNYGLTSIIAYKKDKDISFCDLDYCDLNEEEINCLN